MCRDCPVPNCGARYLVKLSNNLTDVHELDYYQRRKWLQEAKLQPKVKIMIYDDDIILNAKFCFVLVLIACKLKYIQGVSCTTLLFHYIHNTCP